MENNHQVIFQQRCCGNL